MITAGIYAKTRAEIIALFGWNADSLSPDQTLRIDCAVALRLALDDLQGRIVRGESADVSRMLTASEALARLLPPTVLAVPPSEQREDRDAAVAPLLKLFRHLHESVHTLSAENAHLKAQLGVSGTDTPLAGKTITPPTSDIVPPSERAECDAGSQRGPDDPKPPVTIEGKANPPAAPAAPPAKRTPNWDSTPGGKAWRDWHAAGGPGFDPWADNRG